MFYACFTIVLVKNNYFKNKTPQIVQFQFSTAHFYDNLTKNILGRWGNDILKPHFQKNKYL